MALDFKAQTYYPDLNLLLTPTTPGMSQGHTLRLVRKLIIFPCDFL